MKVSESEYLAHYGVLRRSGRYPWGSGRQGAAPYPWSLKKTQPARNRSFLQVIEENKRSGLKETEIAEMYGMSTTDLRALKSIAKNATKQADIGRAQRLKEHGYSNVAIGQKMGINESSVRALLAPGQKDKADILQATSQMLREQVAEKKYIDIGSGVENDIGISKTRLATAVAVLREEGYMVHTVPVKQLGTGLNTQVKTLSAPKTTWGEVSRNKLDIKQIRDYSEDGGYTYFKPKPPIGISKDRIGINYKEDGGALADGVIYIRPNVKDVTLGGASYAQVRILVDKTHYLKGMAVYKDDLPKGVDLVFNTNKSDSGNKLDAMKEVKRDLSGKVDKDNPFGAEISRQIGQPGPKGKLTSVMNIVNQEGDWAPHSKNLSSQMLSKQNPSLAKAQLNMTYERKMKEYDELSKLTNPTVKRDLLYKFADETAASAVHLKAAALNTRQATHVILPLKTIPPGQIYAPNYRDGEKVVLIRHPHAGRFEIPELTVNNKNQEGKKLFGNARDAVGIHPQVAERLSGADFDGDFVIVIPNGSKKIKTAPALRELKDFDPRTSYKAYEGMPKMTPRQKQQEMGYISNLITDMTIKQASPSEMSRAVKHSMVVIDAEKHNLNYRQSFQDNGIGQLYQKYQGKPGGGASTLISRAGSMARVPDRVERKQSHGGPVDKATGKRIYEETGKTYPNKQGKIVNKVTAVEKLALTDDAFTLTSGPPGTHGTPMERVYAEHSNRLKALADQARKESVNTPRSVYSPSAAKTYRAEVTRLNAALSIAESNRPKERQAQIVGHTIKKQKMAAYPDMDSDDVKKVTNQALAEGRRRTGAGKERIVVSPREWQAIQAGAISDTKLADILRNSDVDTIRDLATPKKPLLMTPAKTARAQQMLNSGYTRAEVADALGVSLTTLDTAGES